MEEEQEREVFRELPLLLPAGVRVVTEEWFLVLLAAEVVVLL